MAESEQSDESEGRQSFSHSVSVGIASTIGSIYGREGSVRLAVGSISESRFKEWKRNELIDLIVSLGFEIRSEHTVSVLSLRDLCDEIYDGEEMPNKIPPLSPDVLRKVDKMVRKIQHMWILKQYNQRLMLERLRYAAEPTNEVDNFDYSEEFFDIGDMDEIYEGSDIDSEFFRSQRFQDDQQQPHQQPVTSPSSRMRETDRVAALRHKELLDLPWTEPDWETARRSRNFEHPRRGGQRGGQAYDFYKTTTGRHCCLGSMGEQCDLWEEGQVSEFSPYGPGITCYFKFIKWCIWVFACLSVISLPTLMVNIYGTVHAPQGLTDLATTTIGNLATTITNSSINVNIPGCNSAIFGEKNCVLNRDRIGVFYSSIDLACTIFLLIAFFWLYKYERVEKKKLNSRTYYLSQYAVAVKNLPPGCMEADIRAHFDELLNNPYPTAPIVSVNFAYDNEAEILECTRRGDLIREKTQLIHQHRYQCTHMRRTMQSGAEDKVKKLRREFFKEMHMIDLRIKEYDQSLETLAQTKARPLTAFVTFDERVGAMICKELYNSPSNFCCPASYLLMDGHKLNVDYAPEPSTIIWENLQYGRIRRYLRRILTTFLSLLLIIVSVATTYGAKYLQDKAASAGGDSLCPIGYTSLPTQEQQTIVTQNPSLLHCYCDQMSSYAQETNSYCKSYFHQKLQAAFLTYFASLVVVLVNWLMEVSMRVLAQFEHHHSEDTLERSVFLRLLFLKYLNSSCVFLINNVGFSGYKSVEFDAQWYNSVGVTLILVQVTDILASQTNSIISLWDYYRQLKIAETGKDFLRSCFPLGCILRTCVDRVPPKKCLTQGDLNRIHIGPNFEVSYRYAQLMSTFFVCLTFNTGMPILNFIGFLNFFLFYFVDKYLFINLYRTPNRLSTRIGHMATMMIPVALVVHLSMSIWVLSNNQMFSNHASSYVSAYLIKSASMYVSAGLIYSKIASRQTFPLFVLLILIIVGYILHILLMNICQVTRASSKWVGGDHELRSQISRELHRLYDDDIGQNHSNVSFTRAVQRNLIKGVTTYNVLQNPVYKTRFSISWNFAMTHRHVRSVRLSSAASSVAETRREEAEHVNLNRVEDMRRATYIRLTEEESVAAQEVAQAAEEAGIEMDGMDRQQQYIALHQREEQVQQQTRPYNSPGAGRRPSTEEQYLQMRERRSSSSASVDTAARRRGSSGAVAAQDLEAFRRSEERRK